MRLFEGLVDEGYAGAYDSVRRFAKLWKAGYKHVPSLKQAFEKGQYSSSLTQSSWASWDICLSLNSGHLAVPFNQPI